MTREEAIRILSTRDAHGVLCGYTSGVTEALDMAIEALQNRPQGEWKFVENEMFAGEYFCSICRKRAEVDLYGEWILSNYCPSCGAKMKGGDENESND